MTDENKLIKDSQRGDHAARLMRDELLCEAFDALEKHYVEAMINTGVAERDSYYRDRLHQAVHATRKVREHLATVLTNGKLAKAELNDIAGRRRAA